MKIIFLDIDGIIKNPTNHSEWFSESIMLIIDLCVRTNSRIVIASNWKLLKGTEFFNSMLNGMVIGATPDIHAPAAEHCKELEVLDYLKLHEVDDWIAIDDRAYEYPRTAHKLVLVEGGRFTSEDFNECLKRLL